MDRLVESSLGFVVKVASEYRNCGLPFEDLINEGNVGLVEAARRFDPDRGVRFITYAVWWIRKSILQAVTGAGSIVRMSEGKARRLREVRRTESRLRQELGRTPRRHEIADRLAMAPPKLDGLLQHAGAALSLDTPVSQDVETPLSDRIADDTESVEERLIHRQTLYFVASAFAGLSDRHRVILVLRSGLDGEPPRTLREVGEKLNVSRERVRQIELEARAHLRKRIAVAMRRPSPKQS